MKRLLILALCLVCALFFLVSCTTPAETTADETTVAEETTDASIDNTPTEIVLIEDGKTQYKVTFPKGANLNNTTGTTFTKALSAIRVAFREYGLSGTLSVGNDAIPLGEEDTYVAPAYEILVGVTNRPESQISDELAFNEGIVRVVGNKVIIIGKNDTITAAVVHKFVNEYFPEGGTTVKLPADFSVSYCIDLLTCEATELTYEAMADEMWDDFNEAYWTGNWVNGGGWWDAAEMLETYIDVYEHTRSEEDKEKMLAFANRFMTRNGSAWGGNMYNDDIMWACIAFTRISLLTGEARYGNIARSNFNTVWARAWDSKLGGGLYWTTDNDTKNSCVNCPAAIAACLLGTLYENETYFEYAKKIMDWEFEKMFISGTGQVFDAYATNGNISKWASTYNQGTFIGACTYLYQHTGEQIYLDNAAMAASYAMKNLSSGGVIDNGETGGRDLPGFKGILVRWLYRYAIEVESLEILYFLQNNAAVVYQNRNSDGLCWTNWKGQTPDNITDDQENYPVFGVSTAISLMYNCHQWW